MFQCFTMFIDKSKSLAIALLFEKVEVDYSIISLPLFIIYQYGLNMHAYLDNIVFKMC
jgi:hypothetical protein